MVIAIASMALPLVVYLICLFTKEVETEQGLVFPNCEPLLRWLDRAYPELSTVKGLDWSKPDWMVYPSSQGPSQGGIRG